MAKKIYLFDSFGGEFYSCLFEGLDEDGKPRLTNLTPGQPVENFLNLLGVNGENILDYHLLCEEGQPADTKMVVAMLGQICLYGIFAYERMSNRLNELRKYGIIYNQDLQKLRVRIHEFDDKESDSVKYRVLMYVGDYYIGDGNVLFNSLSEIVSKLAGFIFFIEGQTHIPLMKCLETNEEIKKQIKRISPNLFDEINQS